MIEQMMANTVSFNRAEALEKKIEKLITENSKLRAIIDDTEARLIDLRRTYENSKEHNSNYRRKSESAIRDLRRENTRLSIELDKYRGNLE